MIDTDVGCREADKGEAFRLLSACFQLPEAALGSKLGRLEKQMALVCQPAVPSISRMRQQFEDQGDLESLQIEFSRLFLGPFGVPAPPYGSVYLDDGRSFMGPSTMDVRHRYHQEGLDTSGHFNDAPDHITAELEFVYYLIVKALEAAENADGVAHAGYLEKRQHFLKDHVGAWISDFERRIEANAKTDFFTNLVRATRMLIHLDMQSLSGPFPASN